MKGNLCEQLKWPAHPVPQAFESLSSYLRRTANIYHLTPQALQQFGLQISPLHLQQLDWNPPNYLLQMIAEKTNLSFTTIRNMACKGYAPLLIDSLLPKQNLLQQYTCQFSTICLPGKRMHRLEGKNTVPWLPKKGLITYRCCVKCLAQDQIPYLRLYWQLPWMISCYLHQKYLQIAFPKRDTYITLATMQPSVPPEEVCFLDELTYQGLTTGIINLPNGEKTTISVWLRKLRSLLDELMCSSAALGSSYEIIGYLQRRMGKTFTKLRSQKRLFEELSEQEQCVALHAAGIVVKDLLSGNLFIKWPKNIQRLDRKFLYSSTHHQDLGSYYQLLPKENPDVIRYQTILQELLQKDDGKLWEIARNNPLLAFVIRKQLIKSKKSTKSIQQIEADLKMLGIPIIREIHKKSPTNGRFQDQKN